MFLKGAVVALAIAVSGVLAGITPGMYRIVSVSTLSSARAYFVGQPIYVTEAPDLAPTSMWKITDGDKGGSIITSAALHEALVATSDDKGALIVTFPGDEPPPSQFQISFAGGGAYTIGLENMDLLWTVEEPDERGRLNIELQPAKGLKAQLWLLQNVNEGALRFMET